MFKDKKILPICLFLILTTLLAFLQVWNHEFINLDDNAYITENPHIQNGITFQGLGWAFTTAHAANWHPLTWISHMLDIQMFGLNPQWHHLTNLFFHIANVLLLFSVLHRMTKALWQSAFAAALFALHPLHVESVAWVAERKDVLSTFFWMLTLVVYGYYAERPRVKSYLAVIALFALGLMAKPMLVTLPFVMLLLDYWPLDRLGKSKFAQVARAEAKNPGSERRKKGKKGKQAPRMPVEIEQPTNHEIQWTMIRPLVLEKIPLFALTALSCAATYIAQKAGGAVAPAEAFTLEMRLANGFVSYLIYIAKTIWPENLAVLYPHPGSLPLWQAAGSALFLIAVTFAVLRKANGFPYLPVGWLWFTGTLVPVIGLVQVGIQSLADRYTYIPSIGLFIMAAWGIPQVFKRRPYTKKVLAASAALCLLFLFILTRVQVGYWRNSITLFDHTLNVTENNYFIYNNRGHILQSRGDYAHALEDFTRAIEINPHYREAYINRGMIYNGMGNYNRAVEDFGKAIEINPKYALAFNNRGAGYMALGNSTRAIDDYNMALNIDPDYADAHYNRAIFYQSEGKFIQAIEDYDMAIKSGFDNKAEVFCNRGAAHDSLGEEMKALEDYGKAIELNPGYAKPYLNRGIAYGKLGNNKQAINDFSMVININPKDADAYFNRGVAYGVLGDPERAIKDYDMAISIDPKFPNAYFNRGMTYEILGRKAQALEDLKTGARLGSRQAEDFLQTQRIDWR
jgi:protein O-mannosyl-transferase